MKHVIIGTGAAGITAAKTIRELHQEDLITMISMDHQVHSRCMLHRYISGEREEKALSFVPEDFFLTNRINLVIDEVVHINEKEQIVRLKSGRRVSYNQLLIATGANSFIPPIVNFREAKNVFGLRHLKDAVQIKDYASHSKQILILGSGLVGMDAAYGFLEQKKQVTVVEMADRILPKQLDETAGSAYQLLFEQNGCVFELGKKAVLTTINDSEEITSVVLDDGTILECDMIIVAAGVQPATACAENSGITINRFIKVDDYLNTSCENVYAAGDVNGIAAIWPNARKQGRTAAYNMCGIPTKYDDSYGMKNTMNFYGLTTLSLGDGIVSEGDEVKISEDSCQYKKAILHNGFLKSICIQGSIDYSGIYQYIIKNHSSLNSIKTDIFHLSFADFYGMDEKGQYFYQPSDS